MTEEFDTMIDDLVLFSDEDPELKEGLRWIDEQAKQNGISFYEQVRRILGKYDSEQRVKAWRLTIRWKNV